MSYYLGVDLGQQNDYTAICAIEEKTEPTGQVRRWLEEIRGSLAVEKTEDVTERHYHLRHLERHLGKSYVDIAERIKHLTQRPELQEAEVIVDATGVGRPVVDMLRDKGIHRIAAITITGGDSATRDGVEHRVPKRDLVSTMQVLMQNRRLKIARSIPLRDVLVRERAPEVEAAPRTVQRVPPGAIVGIIGPNGAGKTTLFNLITGAIQPDSGRVTFRGEDITGLPSHKIFEHKLCRTFQIPREHMSMTVLENLMLVPPHQMGERFWNVWLRPAAVRAEEERIRAKADEVLEFIDLAHLRGELAGRLSGGQKKLLELGRILMAEPELVLLDEPGAGVNRTLMQRLTENIQYLQRERGITFLLIEHDMDLVMNVCDPVIVMSEGTKLMQGAPEEVRNDPQVLEAYLGGQYAAAEG